MSPSEPSIDTLKNETVLVTGAGGFIASHIVYQLLSLGYKVKGTVRDPADEASWGHLKKVHKMLFPNIAIDGPDMRLTMVRGDLLNDEQSHWDEVVQGVQYVMHTASPFVLKMSEEQLVKTAIRGTELVLEATGKHVQNIKKVVLTSSVASVMVGHSVERQLSGPFTGKDWSVEENTFGYELSKLRAERRAWEIQKKYGFKMDTICPGLVVGPVMAKHHLGCESATMMTDLMTNKMWLGADIRIAFTDVRDVADLHIRAAVSPKGVNHSGGRYISACTDGSGASLMDAAMIINEQLRSKSGYRPTCRQAPTSLLKLVAPFHPDLKTALAWLGQKQTSDTTEASQDLGMVFRPMKPAIEQMVLSIMQFGQDTRGFEQSTIDELKPYDSFSLKALRTTEI